MDLTDLKDIASMDFGHEFSGPGASGAVLTAGRSSPRPSRLGWFRRV